MENTFSYCFLHFLTFSQLPNKYIIQFFNRLTQILLNSSKPNQKKLIKLGQIHQNPTISQSQTQCDRCRRSRSRTAILASGFAGEVNGCDSKSKLWDRGAIRSRSLWVSGEVEALGSWREVSGSPAKSELWVRGVNAAGAISLAHSLSRVECRSWCVGVWSVRSYDLGFLSIVGLACDRRTQKRRSGLRRRRRRRDLASSRARALSLSLSLSLCASDPEMVWSENLSFKPFPWSKAHFPGQLQIISGKYIFLAQPNTRIYGKTFPEVVWSRNKHSLIYSTSYWKLALR